MPYEAQTIGASAYFFVPKVLLPKYWMTKTKQNKKLDRNSRSVLT